MPSFWVAPTANYLQTTLNGSITNTATTITLNSTTNFQSPGYAVIDRTDSNGTSTPSAREVISYTGVSGSNLTGVTRGVDNSTARSHSDGAVVETMPTVGMWNSLTTIVATAIDSNGLLTAINSPVSVAIERLIQFDLSSVASVARAEIPFLRAPQALMSTVTILGLLNASGASIVGGFTSDPETVRNLAVTSIASIAQLNVGTYANMSGASTAGILANLLGKALVTGTTTSPTTASASDAVIAEMVTGLRTWGGNILAIFSSSMVHSDTTKTSNFGFQLDAGATAGTVSYVQNVASLQNVVCNLHLFTGVSASLHTVAVVWNTNGATLTANGTQRKLVVMEI